jgi:hypothetical protein
MSNSGGAKRLNSPRTSDCKVTTAAINLQRSYTCAIIFKFIYAVIFHTVPFYCLVIKRLEWKKQNVSVTSRSIKKSGRQKHLAVRCLQRTFPPTATYGSLTKACLNYGAIPECNGTILDSPRSIQILWIRLTTHGWFYSLRLLHCANAT